MTTLCTRLGNWVNMKQHPMTLHPPASTCFRPCTVTGTWSTDPGVSYTDVKLLNRCWPEILSTARIAKDLGRGFLQSMGHVSWYGCQSPSRDVTRWSLELLTRVCQLDSLCMLLESAQHHKLSGRSPKVVALFVLQTLVAIWYDFFNCMIQSKWNEIIQESTITIMI